MRLGNRQRLLLRVRQQHARRVCEAHKGDVFGTASNTNFILGLMTSGLAGAATVVTTTLTKSALAAGATFTNAGAAEFNEKIYQKLFVGLIVKAVERNRREFEVSLLNKRRLSIADYPVDDAIRDAEAYHYRCSFYAGVIALNEAIDRVPPGEDEILARVKKIRGELDEIDKQIAKIPEDKRRTSQEVANLNLAKATLQRQIDALYMQLPTARASQVQVPASATAPPTTTPPTGPTAPAPGAPSPPPSTPESAPRTTP